MARASSRGLRVQWADLRSDSGYYEDDRKVITLNLCLTEYQTRSVMAHELSHAYWRDRPVKNRAEHERRERRADSEAARDLISAAEYALAEQLVGPDPGALAEELGVSRWVIEVWQQEARNGRAWTCAREGGSGGERGGGGSDTSPAAASWLGDDVSASVTSPSDV